LRALADVVDDEVAPGLRRLFADHNSDVGDSPPKFQVTRSPGR
jgi:hypothetical protein